MATIVQLSDIHLDASERQAHETIEPLIETLGLFRAGLGCPPDLLVITGDLFDNATIPLDRAVPQARGLLERIDGALGRPMPTVILPGNHDRRLQGLLGPHRRSLFDGLRDALGDRVHVAGCQTPFLAEVVPRSFHQLPASVVCVDSTFVPTGLLGAGGMLRQEDLLEIADQLSDEPQDEPVVVLTHNHLIPTPLADLTRIDVSTGSRVFQWLANKVLARLISNADREEWMMTALGAGTALSTLHAIQRALVVLHGHKHYPTVRALHGTSEDQGDLLLIGAGSAGLILGWDAGRDPDSASLWPSFNAIELSSEMLSVDSVVFMPRQGHQAPEPTRFAARALVRARRDGTRWHVDPVSSAPTNTGPVVARNHARYSLSANAERPRQRWDAEVERTVTYAEGPPVEAYVESIDAAPGSHLSDIRIGSHTVKKHHLPITLRLPADGTPARFRITGGLCRSLDETAAAYGPLGAFEWVELLNRYQCREVALVLEGLPPGIRAFGSAIDLTCGQERPARVVREVARTVLTVRECPPGTLLRILWRPDHPW